MVRLENIERAIANYYLRKKFEKINPMLKKVKDFDILKHISMQIDICTFALWDSPIDIRPNYNGLDKVLEEYYTNPKTAMRPVTNPKTKRPWISHILNLIPNAGLTRSGRYWTGEDAVTPITHMGIGSVAGTLPTDTALNAQILRKDLTGAGGYRKVINRIGIYAILFSDQDGTPPYTIREAGLFTAAVGGLMYVHSNTSEFTLSAGKFWSGKISITYASV